MQLSIIERYRVYKELEGCDANAAAILVLADAIENASRVLSQKLEDTTFQVEGQIETTPRSSGQ